jgi:hypothetical protein
MSKNDPVSPGTPNFATIPYMKAQSPKLAIWFQLIMIHRKIEITGNAVAVPVRELFQIQYQHTSRGRKIPCGGVQSSIEPFIGKCRRERTNQHSFQYR